MTDITKKNKSYIKIAGLSLLAGGIVALIIKRKAIMRAIWDRYTEARLQNLHPAIRQDARNFIAEAEKFGFYLRITRDGHLRSFDEQAELYAKGRTSPGKIVTNAEPGQSYHNYGLALDVVEIKNGKPLWKNEHWGKIAQLAEKYGFQWGAAWNDKPHFQKTFGYHWRDLLAKHNEGEVNGDGYVKLT